MQTITITAHTSDVSQIEAIKAVMKAFKIKFEIENKDLNLEKSMLDEIPQNQMTQKEFVQWIAAAEKSPTMTLDTFNKKWEQETNKIQNLIQ